MVPQIPVIWIYSIGLLICVIRTLRSIGNSEKISEIREPGFGLALYKKEVKTLLSRR